MPSDWIRGVRAQAVHLKKWETALARQWGWRRKGQGDVLSLPPPPPPSVGSCLPSLCCCTSCLSQGEEEEVREEEESAWVDKVGGLPFLSSPSPSSFPPPSAVPPPPPPYHSPPVVVWPLCGVCGHPTLFLSQMQIPLSVDRSDVQQWYCTLALFACARQQCWTEEEKEAEEGGKPAAEKTEEVDDEDEEEEEAASPPPPFPPLSKRSIPSTFIVSRR